jgi:ATP sulfurylase (sulfate adenylyltransferase)
MTAHLNPPHGGSLVDLVASEDRAAGLKAASAEWPSWDLTPRQLCDLELLANGGFSPLSGFLGRADYESVCSSMRLADGTLWTIPVVLDLPDEVAEGLKEGSSLALRDPEGVMLAAIEVQEKYRPDREQEAKAVYGTDNPEHPGVAHLLQQTHPVYVSGRLEAVQLPVHYDFRRLRLTPSELRAEFDRTGWQKVVAFQTRNPMHRAHLELTMRAAKDVEANLLIQPSVGMTKPGDVDHYTRVRCYEALMGRYPRRQRCSRCSR